MKTKLLAILALACLSTLNLQLAAAPVGTAFTYQGVATDNGRPATGLYDVQCALYDSPTGGAQVGPTLNLPGSTTDSNGVFTVLLDFGPGVFTGQALWLQFGVRTNGSMAPFTMLTPRQELTPAPGAIWATVAGTANGLSGPLPSTQLAGAYSNQLRFDNPNNFFAGIGLGLSDVNASRLGGYDASAFLTRDADLVGPRLSVGGNHSLSGNYATIPGGYQNQASGNYSLAAGYRAKAKHAGTFVWADNTEVDFASMGNNQFLIRAIGGVGINTVSPGAALGVEGNKAGGAAAILGTSLANGGVGVQGRSVSTGSWRGYGGDFEAYASEGYGVRSVAHGTNGIGVYGHADNYHTGAHTHGGWFESEGSGCVGVLGRNNGLDGVGVYGLADNTFGTGVVGYGGGQIVPGVIGYDFDARGPGINYGATSSIRWKKDITCIDEPLAKVMALRGVYFNWDVEHGGGHDVGMIAEEVGKVLPEIVGYEANGIDAHGMDYSKLTPLLVEVGKALKTQVDVLREQMMEKEARIGALERDVAELKSLTATLLEQAKGAGK
jgi:hypothetical protein